MSMYRGAIIDLDGTVTRGEQLLPGAERGIQTLRDAGIETLFMSNNPAASPTERCRRLRRVGIDVTPSSVLTSGAITAEYLASEHPERLAYVLGEPGLHEQLVDRGVLTTTDPEQTEVLVGSLDRSFGYETLREVLRALDDDVPFIGTDPDGVIPGGDGDVYPGSGGILGAIEGMTGRAPDAIMGKPSETARQAALDRLDIDAEACLVIGDQPRTDIEMGASAGMTTVLVLTGVTDRDDLARIDPTPDHVLDSLGEIDRLLAQ